MKYVPVANLMQLKTTFQQLYEKIMFLSITIVLKWTQ